MKMVKPPVHAADLSAFVEQDHRGTVRQAQCLRNSNNLPKKTNFKNHSGLDAMTGKGNFDIAEFITLSMLDAFKNSDGHLMLLIKNSVIKNIVFDQNKNKYPISDIEKYCIDSKKEFKVSVEAFICLQIQLKTRICVSRVQFLYPY